MLSTPLFDRWWHSGDHDPDLGVKAPMAVRCLDIVKLRLHSLAIFSEYPFDRFTQNIFPFGSGPPMNAMHTPLHMIYASEYRTLHYHKFWEVRTTRPLRCINDEHLA
jgi:hypothetical protein